MKNVLSFLLLLLVSFNYSFADSTCVRICHNWGFYIDNYDKHIERYDSNGRLIGQEDYELNLGYGFPADTGFRLTKEWNYTYNTNGSLDTVLYAVINSSGTSYSRTGYLYDSNGNIIEKLICLGTSYPLDSNERWTYQYDANDNLINTQYEGYSVNQFWKYYVESWMFDSRDSLLEYRKINYWVNSPHDSIVETNGYGTNGKLAWKFKCTYPSANDSTYYQYAYDSNDSLFRISAFSDGPGNTWIPSFINDYGYSSNTLTVYYRYCHDPGCSDTTAETTFTYDSTGRVISYYWTNLGGDASMWDYIFDSNGNLITNYSHWTGPGCDGTDITTYDYNSSNNVIHSYSEHFHCDDSYSDCIYYNLTDDSILVAIDMNNILCSYSDVPLQITVEGGIPPYQYDWTPGIFLSDSTILNPAVLNADSSVIYQLKVTDSNGRIQSDTAMINILPDLYIPVTINQNGPPCEKNAYFTHSPIPNTYSFYWRGPSSYFIPGDSILSTVSGIYTLSLTDQNGCKYDYSYNAVLNPAPNVTLGSDTNVCTNDTIILDAGSFSGYNWNTGDITQTIFATSPIQTTNTYFVRVTDQDGCMNSDTINISYFICSGINELSLADVNVFQYENFIRVEVPGDISTINFSLVDIFGRTILRRELIGSTVIDISYLPGGIYVFRINDLKSGTILKP